MQIQKNMFVLDEYSIVLHPMLIYFALSRLLNHGHHNHHINVCGSDKKNMLVVINNNSCQTIGHRPWALGQTWLFLLLPWSLIPPTQGKPDFLPIPVFYPIVFAVCPAKC